MMKAIAGIVLGCIALFGVVCCTTPSNQTIAQELGFLQADLDDAFLANPDDDKLEDISALVAQAKVVFVALADVDTDATTAAQLVQGVITALDPLVLDDEVGTYAVILRSILRRALAGTNAEDPDGQ